jgi:hypothetical protein
MTNLYDSATGAEFRLGHDGRYYHGGVGYEVAEGDKSPLEGSDGTLISTPPNTAVLPDQGAGPATTTMGQTGNEHAVLAAKMVERVAQGVSPTRLVDRLINVTSPLQVTQQGVLDAFQDFYEGLASGEQGELKPFMEKFDADPLYTVDVLMADVIASPQVSETSRNSAREIVARYNLSIPC